MGLFSKLFGGSGERAGAGAGGKPGTGEPEEAVILTIVLPDDAFGTAGERARLHAIQDELSAALKASGAGELDGDEFGEGKCLIFMYGASAERVWEAIAPALEKHPFPKGSAALKRYGPPNEGVKSESVDLAWDG